MQTSNAKKSDSPVTKPHTTTQLSMSQFTNMQLRMTCSPDTLYGTIKGKLLSHIQFVPVKGLHRNSPADLSFNMPGWR